MGTILFERFSNIFKEDVDRKIIEKGEEYGKQIDNLISKNKDGQDVTDEIDDLKDKIKRFVEWISYDEFIKYYDSKSLHPRMVFPSILNFFKVQKFKFK